MMPILSGALAYCITAIILATLVLRQVTAVGEPWRWTSSDALIPILTTALLAIPITWKPRRSPPAVLHVIASLALALAIVVLSTSENTLALPLAALLCGCALRALPYRAPYIGAYGAGLLVGAWLVMWHPIPTTNLLWALAAGWLLFVPALWMTRRAPTDAADWPLAPMSTKEQQWAIRMLCALGFVVGAIFAATPVMQREVLRNMLQDWQFLALATWLGLLVGALAGRSRKNHIGWLFWVLLPLIFALADLAWGTDPHTTWHETTVSMYRWPHGWRLTLDWLLIGFGCGFAVALVSSPKYCVPDPLFRYLAWAGLPLFAIFGAWTSRYGFLNGLSAPGLLLGLAAVGLILLLFLFWQNRLQAQRALAQLVSAIFYDFRVRGLENVPPTGSALLIANHVSYYDAPLLMAALPREVRFVVDAKVHNLPWFYPFLVLSRVIRVATGFEDRKRLSSAFGEIAEALHAGDVVGLFPEGRITANGKLSKLQPGIRRILRETRALVLPAVIIGMWGSTWSRYPGPWWRRWWRRPWRSTVTVQFLPPIAAEDFDLATVQNQLSRALGEEPAAEAVPPADEMAAT